MRRNTCVQGQRFKCHQRVIRETQARINPREQIANLDGATVVPITRDDAEPIILDYEWLGTMGRAQFVYGLVIGGELFGVSCFGLPAGNRAGDICGKELSNKAICLERGACVHWAPSNAASFLVSHAVRAAYKDHGKQIFYAYADPAAREIGQIYQACNWYYLGQGVGRTPGRMRELFREPGTEKWISDRTLRHRKLKKSEILRAGWEIKYTPPKHKYVWFDGSRLERKRLRELCRYSFLPYPRPAPP